jgi:hypothetical protein
MSDNNNMNEIDPVKALEMMQKFLSATDAKFEEMERTPEKLKERIVDDIHKKVFKTHDRGGFSKIYKLDEKYGFTLESFVPRGSKIRFVLLENGKKLYQTKILDFIFVVTTVATNMKIIMIDI